MSTYWLASTAWPRVSATTTATGSPAKRTTSLASTGRRISCGVSTGGPAVANGSRFRSAAVYTPTTPGIPAASAVSTPLTFAWAKPERTNTAYSASALRRSSV